MSSDVTTRVPSGLASGVSADVAEGVPEGRVSRFPDRRAGVPAPCAHQRLAIGRLHADVCPEGPVGWSDGEEEIDPAVALAILFGQFELVSAVDGLRSPGPTVFVYRPDGRRGRSVLRDLPAEGWLEGAPGLWIGRDDRHLLICPSDPVLAANLLRRS